MEGLQVYFCTQMITKSINLFMLVSCFFVVIFLAFTEYQQIKILEQIYLLVKDK
jgi:hypothetical protein